MQVRPERRLRLRRRGHGETGGRSTALRVGPRTLRYGCGSRGEDGSLRGVARGRARGRVGRPARGNADGRGGGRLSRDGRLVPRGRPALSRGGRPRERAGVVLLRARVARRGRTRRSVRRAGRWAPVHRLIRNALPMYRTVGLVGAPEPTSSRPPSPRRPIVGVDTNVCWHGVSVGAVRRILRTVIEFDYPPACPIPVGAVSRAGDCPADRDPND